MPAKTSSGSRTFIRPFQTRVKLGIPGVKEDFPVWDILLKSHDREIAGKLIGEFNLCGQLRFKRVT